LRTYRDFLMEFIRNPKVIGSVAPSSRTLVDKMIERIDFEKVDVAVEYGPGSGRITRELLKRMKPGSTYFGIEINGLMVRNIRNSLPEATVYKDSVVNVSKYLEKHNKNHADVIISGLPWANFPKDMQKEIMGKTFDVLLEGGIFITYAYCHGTLLPAGKRFKYLLSEYFPTITKSSIALLNIPPAFVYHCEK